MFELLGRKGGQEETGQHLTRAPQKRLGFTLVELIVVIAILVIIASVGIPSLLRGRAAANEAAAAGSLRTLATIQAIFKQQAEVDQNGNGIGEYGLLGELACDIALRPATARLAQPVYASQQFRTGGNTGNGTASKSGFYFVIYLSNATLADPDAVGSDRELGGNSTTGGSAADPIGVSRQEHSFALYTWPMEFPRSGTRCFFVNETADVYTSKMDAQTYNGLASMPSAPAAYVSGSSVFKGRIASGPTVGNDNNHWFPAGG